MGSFRVAKLARRMSLGLVLTVLVACSETPTGVVDVVAETEFAASLGIDLATMQRRSSGVYFKDIVEGSGDEAAFGLAITVLLTGWLPDGTQFQMGEITFLMGNNTVVSGIEDGILNTRVGGKRLMVVPPKRAYGGLGLFDAQGNQLVPPDSVVVYEVVVLGVTS